MNNDKSKILAEITEITDENNLLEIFENNNDFEIRYAIANLINDDSILYGIFSKEQDQLIKSTVLNRISTDILDYNDFNALEEYEKIIYMENHSNESLFRDIAEKDNDLCVRVAAICKIQDRDFLWDLANSHGDYNTRVVLYKMLNDKSFLEEITGDNLTESRISLVNDLDNEKFLKDIAINDSNLEIQLLALKNLNRPHFYFDLLKYSLKGEDLRRFVKALASYDSSQVIRDYDDFKERDMFERLAYIETHYDESLFPEVVENDEDFEVIAAAIDKIQDRDFLLDLANSHKDYIVRIVLYKKLNNESVFDEITGEDIIESRIRLVNKLDNEKFLEDIASIDDAKIAIPALKKLNRPAFFFNILMDTFDYFDLEKYIKILAVNEGSDDILDYKEFNKRNIYEKLTYIETHSDEALFRKVVEKDKDFRVRVAAIYKISDRNLLLDLASSHKDYGTRVVIYKKLNDKYIFDEITDEDLTESHKNLVHDLDNERFLEDIVGNDSSLEVKNLTLKKLNKSDLYFNIVNASDHNDIRQLIENIKDESKLVDIINFFFSDSFIVENAVNNISNLSVLYGLYLRGLHSIQEAVMKKLVFGNVFSNEKITDKISIGRLVLSVCPGDVFADIVRNGSDGMSRRDAIRLIRDDGVLADFANNDSFWIVRRDAARLIRDKDVLADIARNGWDRDVRSIAVQRIHDENVLEYVAKNDSDSNIRYEAVQKISDEDVLADIARNDSSEDVRRVAVQRIHDENALIDIARNDSSEEVRWIAVEKIGGWDVFEEILGKDSNGDIDRGEYHHYDDGVLMDIIRNSYDYHVLKGAVLGIRDNNVLVEVAKGEFLFPASIEAIRGISDEDVLADIARNGLDSDARGVALEKIDDNDVLVDVLRNDSSVVVRSTVFEKVNDADTLQMMILENFGYFPIGGYSEFKRNLDEMIYESIGTDVYDYILDKLDESVLTDLIHEKLFGDFRVLIVRRLTSGDVLRNLALNDLDYRVRREAVMNPNLCNSKTFAKIVKSDYNDSVRLEALRRIDDNYLLEEMTNDLSPIIRLYAFQRLAKSFDLKEDVPFEDIDLSSIETIEDENVLYSIVKNAPSASIRRYAFNKIKDESILANIASCSAEFMNSALGKITDKNFLLNIALYSTDISAKRKAIKKIDDEQFLLKAVQDNPYTEISEYIVGRIRDESLLEIIALNNSNPYNRKAAVNKIKSQDVLTCIGETESEEVVCAAIVRKTQDKTLLEYIGLSNPCKTVRRYVESIVDDEELLYKFALNEYESDNRREIISKLTNEEYIVNLLKRESHKRVFNADFNITNTDLLIDLAKNAFSAEVRYDVLKKIKDKSVIRDFICNSPFCSINPRDKSVWVGMRYGAYDKKLCVFLLNDPNFNDTEFIGDFLIENEFESNSDRFDLGDIRTGSNSIGVLADRITEISSIYRIALNCKSNEVRRLFKPKLEYPRIHINQHDEDYDETSEEDALSALAALFG